MSNACAGRSRVCRVQVQEKQARQLNSGVMRSGMGLRRIYRQLPSFIFHVAADKKELDTTSAFSDDESQGISVHCYRSRNYCEPATVPATRSQSRVMEMGARDAHTTS